MPKPAGGSRAKEQKDCMMQSFCSVAESEGFLRNPNALQGAFLQDVYGKPRKKEEDVVTIFFFFSDFPELSCGK